MSHLRQHVFRVFEVEEFQNESATCFFRRKKDFPTYYDAFLYLESLRSSINVGMYGGHVSFSILEITPENLLEEFNGSLPVMVNKKL